MKFIDKVEAKEIMLFAREHLIGRVAGVESLKMFTEKHKAGWLVEHDYRGPNGSIAKEGFLFSDFAISYLVGGVCTEQNLQYILQMQDVYTDMMTQKFGDEYARDLERVRYEASCEPAKRMERSQRRELWQAKVDEYLSPSSDTDAASQSSCTMAR